MGQCSHVDPGEVVAGVADQFADGGVSKGDRGADAELAAGDFGFEAVDIVDGQRCLVSIDVGAIAGLDRNRVAMRAIGQAQSQQLGQSQRRVHAGDVFVVVTVAVDVPAERQATESIVVICRSRSIQRPTRTQFR